MATAKTETLLPLDTFAALLGIHPLHFNQVEFGQMTGCGNVYLQYDWQGPNAISRESIAFAIHSAENRLEQFLGFPVYPKWYDDYPVEIPTNKAVNTYPYWSMIQPYAATSGIPVVLPKAYYITGGKKRLTKIGTASISYDDVDEDGYPEKATAQISTSVTDTDEIKVYYPDLLDGWQIRPTQVSISSGLATINLARHDLVLPELLEALRPGRVAGDDDDLFLSSIDVYREYNDPSVQGLLRACATCGTSGSCLTCQFAEETACLLGTEPKEGIVNFNPATWDGTQWTQTCCFNKDAYFGRSWFKAGWNLEHIWDQVIALLALTELHVDLCSCATVQTRVKWWTDEAKSDLAGSARVPNTMLFCPWGHSRAAHYAYGLALKYRMPQGA